MNIIRYQIPTQMLPTFTPLARLGAFRQTVDRLFDLSVDGRGVPAGPTPVMDLYQDQDTLFARVELPGLKKEDVNVTLHDGVLTLSGELKARGEKTILRNERRSGPFRRGINLPFAVDGSRVTAAYEDGILTVTLPKSEEAKPRQIEINVK